MTHKAQVAAASKAYYAWRDAFKAEKKREPTPSEIWFAAVKTKGSVDSPAPAASEPAETPEQRAFRENESLDAMIRRAGGRPFLERSAQGRKALAQMEAIDRARSIAASEPRVLGAGLDPWPNSGDPVISDALRAPDDARTALLDLWSAQIDASVRAELMGALVRYLDAVTDAQIAAIVDAAVKAEQAACARFCDALGKAYVDARRLRCAEAAASCAAHIRARSLTTSSTTSTLPPHETPTTE